MDNSKYSTMRVVLILLAIVSVVLGVMRVVKLTGSGQDKPQTDLSGYGTQADSDSSGGIYYEDDDTVEMDSIPNDAMTSGGDVSGTDVSTADAE